MKATYFAAVALVAVFLLSSGGLLFANASAYSFHRYSSHHSDTPDQPLKLLFGGTIANAGIQTYHIDQSGWVFSATAFGVNLNPAQSQLDYSLKATVEGLSVSGNAHFHLTGVSAKGGQNVAVTGDAVIVGMVPALCLPSYSARTCAPKDTSAVPAFFVGIGTIEMSASPTKSLGIPEQAPTFMYNVQMLFESAYLNPFGAPIAFGTADNFASMLVVTPYSHATIDWDGVIVTGEIRGTMGQSQVAGTYTQVINENENLVSGMAIDSGQMTFSHIVNQNNHPINSLDVSGHFYGMSVIPTTQPYECLTSQGTLGQCSNSDCSISIGFPMGSGVCTNTGFESMGTFNLHGHDSDVSGAYNAAWSSPAFALAAMADGTLVDQ